MTDRMTPAAPASPRPIPGQRPPSSMQALCCQRRVGGTGVASVRVVRPARRVLLVESDAGCGQALARLVRRSGDQVRLVRTPGAAVAAAQRESFDLAVVDLLVQGGGVDLARRLTPRVSRVYLSVGARLLTDELLEAAIGFPVLRKRELPGVIGSSGSDQRARRPGSPARTGSTPRSTKAPAS